MRRAVAVSPHLDDAVFSAGTALATLAAAGWEVCVVTAFTRSVPEPTGFALGCQTDKGLGPEVDYMALRREEDAAALRALGLPPPVHLPFAEAPHRGYDSAPALFEAPRGDDEIAAPLAAALAPLLDGADLGLAPLALGGHVDHLQVRAALRGRPIVSWHDLPYALRQAGPAAGHEQPPSQAKLDACAAYASQLGFQFGGDAPMRAALTAAPERFDAPLAAGPPS